MSFLDSFGRGIASGAGIAVALYFAEWVLGLTLNVEIVSCGTFV